MGFFKEFAYGAAQTLPGVLKEKEAEKLQQQKYDEELQLKVKSVDPEAALYQRKADIDTAAAKAKQDRDMAALLAYKKVNSDTTTPDSDNPLSSPTPTITTPGTTSVAPNMAPSTDGSQPAFFKANNSVPTEPDHMSNYLAANRQAEEADVISKVNPLFSGVATAKKAEAAQHLAAFNRQQKQQSDLSTAAHNASSDIMKEANDRVDPVKGSGANSLYQVDEAGQPISLALPDAKQTEKDIAGQIHAPLTAAQMKEEGLKKTDTTVVGETVQPTKDIVALKSKTTTDDQKVTAWASLKSYLQETYGSNAWDKIQADTHLKSVFKDPTLKENIYRAEQGIPTQAKGSVSNTAPVADNPTVAEGNNLPIKNAVTSGIPVVASDADYANIPVGGQYKDPQGNIRTKKAQ